MSEEERKFLEIVDLKKGFGSGGLAGGTTGKYLSDHRVEGIAGDCGTDHR